MGDTEDRLISEGNRLIEEAQYNRWSRRRPFTEFTQRHSEGLLACFVARFIPQILAAPKKEGASFGEPPNRLRVQYIGGAAANLARMSDD